MDNDTIHDLRVAADWGRQISQFMNSEPGRAAVAIAKAQIYDRWSKSETVTEREEAHAEHTALERLLGAFHEIQNSGVLAQEALSNLDD